jgi:PAS domain S-box-containing protein
MDGVAAPGAGDIPMLGQLALSGNLLSEVLENMAESALVVDDDGLIVAANGAARSLLGRDDAELIGQDSHDLLHRDNHGHLMPRSRCQMRRALLTRDTRHGDAEWFVRGDGAVIQLSWLVTPYTVAPGVTGALVLLHTSRQEESQRSDDGYCAPLTELDRLALLAETTTRLTSTLDVDEALHRLAALTVPRLADWAVCDVCW